MLTDLFEKIVEKKEQALVIAGIGSGKTYSSIKVAKGLVDNSKVLKTSKVLYISHYLTAQGKFTEEFKSYGLEPIVYNSSLNDKKKQEILNMKNGLIICTVEALLIHMSKFLDNCSLIIFDEFHLISEETYRDAYKYVEQLLIECKKRKIPFIGLTATMYYSSSDAKSENTLYHYLKIYDTGIKSRINVSTWNFTRLSERYLKVPNEQKSGIVVGLLARLLDKYGDNDYNHVIIYCNNKYIGLKLKENGYLFKLICSDIKNQYYDMLYNGECFGKSRFYEQLLNDNLSDYKYIFATESISAGLNLNSIKGNILCINVTDNTNSIINACQFVGRFRKADSIDVIQLNVAGHEKTKDGIKLKWHKVKNYHRKLDIMKQYVKEQYNNVQINVLDLTDMKPKRLKKGKRFSLRRYLKIAKEMNIAKAFLKALLGVLDNNSKPLNSMELINILFQVLLQCKGRKVKGYKHKDKVLYKLDNSIRDKFLNTFKLLNVRKLNVKYIYNGNGTTVYAIEDDGDVVDISNVKDIGNTKALGNMIFTLNTEALGKFGSYYRLLVELIRIRIRNTKNSNFIISTSKVLQLLGWLQVNDDYQQVNNNYRILVDYVKKFQCI